MIQLEHISKSFVTASGTVHAVQDVNLQIGEGEIFGIIGFSGAGKSTLVRCINLLERHRGWRRSDGYGFKEAQGGTKENRNDFPAL